MRVLMISKACVVGQYQIKLEELARHRDIELTVVVPPFWRDERGVISLERLHTNGYSLLVEPMRLNGQFHLHYYPTLPKIIARIRPDIVHIDEEPYNLATFLALRAALRAHAKILFFTWQNLQRRYPPPFSWIENYNLQRADYAIAGNQEAAQVLRHKNYRGPLRVIPQFGVDPNEFSATKINRNDPTFRIGFAARFVEEKGLAVLFRALAAMEGDWELRVLGSGPEQARLKAQARDLEIEKRVLWYSPRPSTEMPEFFRELDVFVLPSITRPNWKEQFGRVLIEAMACEVPVIGSTCGEIPNVIGDAGIVFLENDDAALRMQLDLLRRDPARREEMAQRGRARVLEHFTHARIAQETYEVYCELVGKRVDTVHHRFTERGVL